MELEPPKSRTGRNTRRSTPAGSHVGPVRRALRRCAILANVNLDRMIAELRTELAATEEAILVLERLQRGSGKRRGRPPRWLAEMMSRDRAKGRVGKRSQKERD